MKKKILPIVELFLSEEILEKSINEIGSFVASNDNRTNLSQQVSEAMQKPIKLLYADEIAMLLRQSFGKEVTLALGLMLISEEPMICADSYSGDILKLTLEHDWEQWLSTEKYGIDPYGLISMIESTIVGIKELGNELTAPLGKISKVSHHHG